MENPYLLPIGFHSIFYRAILLANIILNLKSYLFNGKQINILSSTNDAATYRPTQVVVVGGGAAGIELSLAMRARWDALIKKNIPATADSSSQLSITLLDSNDQLLPSENLACRTALKNLMDKYNVNIRHNVIVHEVTSSHIHIGPNNRKTSANVIDESTSSKIPYTHCIWATGAESHKLSWDLHRQCGLSISKDRGWIQVNQYLQSVSHPYIFAAGDCCEILNGNKKSPPKAGVYAVRSGPILIENLTRLLGENANNLVPYEPQDDFLKLIMAGDGTALGFRFGIPLYGKWVWQLKDHIDRMFMDLFDVRHLPKCKASSSDVVDDQVVEAGNSAADMSTRRPKSYETSQYDAIIERPPPMNAVDAAKLLVRTDDDVEFHLAWNVLRDMMADENYMSEVLNDISGI